MRIPVSGVNAAVEIYQPGTEFRSYISAAPQFDFERRGGCGEQYLKRDAAPFILSFCAQCAPSPPVSRQGDWGSVCWRWQHGSRSADTRPACQPEVVTKEDEFSENFSQLVLRFTDSTYDEIKKGGSRGSGCCDAGLLRESQNAMRHDRMLKYNLEGRIPEDLLGDGPAGFFVAFILANAITARNSS